MSSQCLRRIDIAAKYQLCRATHIHRREIQHMWVAPDRIKLMVPCHNRIQDPAIVVPESQ